MLVADRPLQAPAPAPAPSLRPDAPLVLVVEDEHGIADVVQAYLRREGLRTVVCGDGVQALAEFERLRPDLVLLDIQLPGMDGIDVLRNIRAHSDAPVIMLTAFVEDVDRLLGLRLGADDYVTKPFVPAEVAARVRAVLRRCMPRGVLRGPGLPPATEAVPAQVLRFGALEIDLQAHGACTRGADGQRSPLSLTLTEFRLLACLAAQPRRVFTRETLIEQCLPESEAFDRVIDSHLSKLRRKLTAAGMGELIDTVRGVGYRLSRDG